MSRYYQFIIMFTEIITTILVMLGLTAAPADVKQLTADALTQPQLLWYNRPAVAFEESMPIGNGQLGALIYGGVQTDSIYLNDLTFWTGRPVADTLGQGRSKWIPEIRKAVFSENYRLTDSLQHHVQGPNSSFYQPIGLLTLTDLDAATPGHRQGVVPPWSHHRRGGGSDIQCVTA